MARIGQGSDVHRLSPGRELRLGGITVPFERGLDGHSDGDVLLHAVANALLGAVGEGDIGLHFPDSDERWRGVDSAAIVDAAMARVRRRALEVVNLDATVVAEAPRLAPHRRAMQERIAALLGVAAERVNVKFRTAERLGEIGRGEAIGAEAAVLLDEAGGR